MRSLRDSFRLLARGFEGKPLWEYWLAFKNTFWEKFWGPSLIGVIFGLLTLFLVPSKIWFLVYLLIVTFIAGYHMWREEHIRWRELDGRLTPKFKVPNRVEFQPVTTTGEIARKPGRWESIWVQLSPQCLTDASVEDCSGHLRRVLRWNEEKRAWERTLMSETVPLGWSLAGDRGFSPITLEPRIEKRLNIFHVDTPLTFIFPAVGPLSSVWEKVFTPQDTFLFDITVRAKDCPWVDVYVKVKWGVPWDKPLAEIISRPDASILPD